MQRAFPILFCGKALFVLYQFGIRAEQIISIPMCNALCHSLAGGNLPINQLVTHVDKSIMVCFQLKNVIKATLDIYKKGSGIRSLQNLNTDFINL